MDALKKIVADRLRVQPTGPHPDAEVLSAFAENALPAKERDVVLQHLSSCTDCRDIIFLASATPTDTQQVIAVPKHYPRFALRWGTLAACVVIGAAVLLSRPGRKQESQVALKSDAYSSAPAPQRE